MKGKILMKIRLIICMSILISMLFSGCAPDIKNAVADEDNINITRDQAIQIIKNISNGAQDTKINSYAEMDKVVNKLRYYFIQVNYSDKMSAAYFVDAKQGNVYIAINGEFDVKNPLSLTDSGKEGNSPPEGMNGATEITCPASGVLKDIFDSIGMTEEQVEQKYGAAYKKIYVSYNGLMKGFFYSDMGFTIAFGNDGKVAYVYCSDKIDIKGARPGMDFSQIQKILGNAVIFQNWAENPVNSLYEIRYVLNGRKVVFFSRQEEGNDSIMSIS